MERLFSHSPVASRRGLAVRAGACTAAWVAFALGVPGPAAAARHGRPAAARMARPTIPARAGQALVVSRARDGHVTLRAYARRGHNGRWYLALGPWPAEIGRTGLRRHRHEGDGSTPIGVFGIAATLYGDAPRPAGLHARYRHLRCGDWWDEDSSSRRYNQLVSVPCGVTPSFAGSSEALWTETNAYPYFAVIDFNMNPIRRGAGAPGSGIFLHAWIGAPTDGCVALRRRPLLRVLRWLAPREHPVIAIGVGAPVRGATGASK